MCTRLTDKDTGTLHLTRLQLDGIGLVRIDNTSREGAGRISNEKTFAGPELEGGFNTSPRALESLRNCALVSPGV